MKSQDRLNRSPISNNSSGGRSSNRQKRSYSTDPDSDERAFVYPCQAFKQFLLSMKEGNINLSEIANQPQVAEILNASDKLKKPNQFESSLRSTSNSSQHRRNPSKPRARSKALSMGKSKASAVGVI